MATIRVNLHCGGPSNASRTAGVLAEAFERYLGWDVYHHEAPQD